MNEVSSAVSGPGFLTGGGEMGAIVGAHDWSVTPLGPIERWPSALRVTLATALASPFPMVLAWGWELVTLHNDAYRPLLGSKAGALGRSFLDVWTEARDTIAPLLQRALEGEASRFADAPLTLSRGREPEEAFFDFAFSPIRDEQGIVVGVLNTAVETTARVLAERARRDAERRLTEAVTTAELSADFRALFEASPTPLLVVEPPDWTIVAANEARLRVTGRTREDQIGRRLFEAFPDDPDDPDADGVRNLTASLVRVIATRSTDTMAVQRYALRGPDGRFVDRWWAPVNTPVLDRAGDVALIIHHVEDVTEVVRLRGDANGRDQLVRGQQLVIDRLRASEAALRESEEFSRRVLESSSDFIKVLDLDGRLESLSEGGRRAIGIADVGSLIGRVWAETFEPDGRAAAHEAVAEARAGRTARFEAALRTQAGALRWWDTVVAPISGPDGRPERLLALSRDTTERLQAEQALRDSEARFRLMADAVPQIVWITDAEGRTEFLNRRWFDYTGTRHTPPAAADVAEQFMHSDDAARTIQTFRQARRGVVPFEVEHRIRSASGEFRWFLRRAEPYRDPATGEVVRWFGASVDIHDRRQAEAALRELNETLESQVAERTADRDRMWRLTTDIMLVARTDATINAVNPAWTTLLGWGGQELVGRAFLDFVHPDDQAATLRETGRLADGATTFRFENRYRTKDGSYVWISWTAVPAEDLIHAVGRDVTAEKAAAAELEVAQEALRQSQKMEAMGQLTGGVAHDFNNLLTPIIGSLDMLTRRGVGTERERRLVDGALQSADRAKTLVQRLLAFARRQPLQPTAVDLGALVRGMAGLIESTIGPTIDVEVLLADELPPAKADPNQLEMALLNLAVNARDAMPNGGALTIEVKRDSVRAGHRTKVKPGHYLVLSVSDTGVGMDEATRARAVEPFFSTKGIGKGTGLGLSMVHGLAGQLGGALAIRSAPARGTTIELWLPVSLAAVGAEHVTSGEPPAPRGRGRALLVDDEDLVRMSTADMLMDLGFEVTEAGSAEEALRLIAEGEVPDLLVTDHLMPGMSGADLARELRAKSVGLPVLIVSGYAEAEGIAPDLPRLTKPFRAAELAECIANLDL